MLDLVKFINISWGQPSTHNGDVHFSREFIKHFVSNLPAKRYLHIHAASKRIILDIPMLEYSPIDHQYDNKRPWKLNRNVLILNAWLGSRQHQFDYWHTIKPYEGAFFRASYQHWSLMIEELRRFGIHVPILGPMKDYIPVIDYNYYEKTMVDKFVNTFPGIKVLICNGNVRSEQIKNFSFDSMIRKLSDNRRLNIITTQQTNIPGVHCTTDIIKVRGGDLNEISYLSKFCNVIIGRGSGPYCFCEVQDNCYDLKKRMIGITNDRGWAFWYHNPKNMRWTNNFHTTNLINMFYTALAEIKPIKLI